MPMLNYLAKLHIESYRDEIGLAKKSVSHNPSYYSGGTLAPFMDWTFVYMFVCSLGRRQEYQRS